MLQFWFSWRERYRWPLNRLRKGLQSQELGRNKTSGAKAPLILQCLLARLKSCPFTKRFERASPKTVKSSQGTEGMWWWVRVLPPPGTIIWRFPGRVYEICQGPAARLVLPTGLCRRITR